MKKFLVRALCRLGLWGLAFAISPSLACYYAAMDYEGFLYWLKYKVEEESE